ncbi:hypothetical protein [Mixta gaviniae]|uniref:hypothetical protein n=1 Tax=Mixta gaviniae TaxID=665914 RepID=UPI00142D7502|nr:hypothetical protein [Mixta gaviniae]
MFGRAHEILINLLATWGQIVGNLPAQKKHSAILLTIDAKGLIDGRRAAEGLAVKKGM